MIIKYVFNIFTVLTTTITVLYINKISDKRIKQTVEKGKMAFHFFYP